MNERFTTHPKSIIQVFHKYHDFGKPENTPACRKAVEHWNSAITSASGYVTGNRAVLNDSIDMLRFDFQRCSALILNDYDSEDSMRKRMQFHREGNPHYSFLMQLSMPGRFELFTIHKSEKGLEIHLDYTSNRLRIGEPARNNFKLGELRLHQPVRISINGKTDHSAFGSPRARTYHYADYIFIYLGEYAEFEAGSMNDITTSKIIPAAEARHVDLNAILY